MPHRRISHLVVPAVIGLATIASAMAIPVASASAATSSVNVNARCSGTSVSNLQVQREDTGKLSVDFGVDMARHTAGVPWKFVQKDNGTVFANGIAKTVSDGSFSVTRLIAPKPGTNTIIATAKNTLTGETCTIRAAL